MGGAPAWPAVPAYDALVAARCGLQWEARGWYGSPMHRVLGLDATSADVQPSPAIAIGSDRDGPIFPATAAPSVGAAYLATLGISAALVARQRTGRGQLVETSLMQGVLMTNAAGWQRPAARGGARLLRVGSGPPPDLEPASGRRRVGVHVGEPARLGHSRRVR